LNDQGRRRSEARQLTTQDPIKLKIAVDYTYLKLIVNQTEDGSGKIGFSVSHFRVAKVRLLHEKAAPERDHAP